MKAKVAKKQKRKKTVAHKHPSYNPDKRPSRPLVYARGYQPRN